MEDGDRGEVMENVQLNVGVVFKKEHVNVMTRHPKMVEEIVWDFLCRRGDVTLNHVHQVCTINSYNNNNNNNEIPYMYWKHEISNEFPPQHLRDQLQHRNELYLECVESNNYVVVRSFFVVVTLFFHCLYQTVLGKSVWRGKRIL